ncbi:uncharacterized protein Z518_10646 [Rhinocladiella mackenziei CBS 650.93]|uniref:Uncharacterized protein n=1 Tax=Rhinocladiella mackenziei CBS 650.93 TaxID=1442369 RepID=A0A0D2IB60_9EURO|nr:uncharacterized protein Z518_10646 [Rhinocladiella mackenziei CBS 650.93]KIX00506.1 hypothetical protein Z518_10646 [Rhinocladiella mackenziei CBS 650.93]
MAYWHDRPATAAVYIVICLLTVLLRPTSALSSVSGSPCESVCSDAGNLEDDIVCLDADYQSLSKGRAFQKCVGCQLNSTAVDTGKNETDVEWGLCMQDHICEETGADYSQVALRFTLAGCMFAIPEPHISISSPCQVSCALLNESIGYQVTTDSSDAEPGNDYCTEAPFDDDTINKCAFCYSFIPQQLYLANFLQALHISCRDPPQPGEPFFPDAAAIFNETLIAGPAPPSNSTSSGGGLHGWQLGIAIALPIVGGILLIGGTCWGCFVFTRRRRQKMAQTGRMSRVHDAHADSMYSPMSAKAEASWKAEAWGQAEPPREMHAISPTLLHAGHGGKHPSPGIAQGRWSHHTGGENSEQNTPLRSSFQRDDVGPGTGQVQDPNLHEQYFGVGGDVDVDMDDTEGADHREDGLVGPSAVGAVGVPHGYEHGYEHGQGYYTTNDQDPRGQLRVHDDERGEFI